MMARMIEKNPTRVTPDALRFAMRRWATGVTVVTSSHGANQHGMTVSSFTSLSLEPPLVMVSLEISTRTHDLVQASNCFGVTILAVDQPEISSRFAEPSTESEYRFEGLESFTLETGSPFIEDGLAFFDCRVVGRHDAGTHTVFIGEVVAARQGPEKNPLLYFDQRYRSLTAD
jgi:flavin reductase (DIM6/NTAB) family NADH-FMN oxidoreductase RutF